MVYQGLKESWFKKHQSYIIFLNDQKQHAGMFLGCVQCNMIPYPVGVGINCVQWLKEENPPVSQSKRSNVISFAVESYFREVPTFFWLQATFTMTKSKNSSYITYSLLVTVVTFTPPQTPKTSTAGVSNLFSPMVTSA